MRNGEWVVVAGLAKSMHGRVVQGFFAGVARFAPGEKTSSRTLRRWKCRWSTPIFGGDARVAIDLALVGLLRSGGAALPDALLAETEEAFGEDSRRVRPRRAASVADRRDRLITDIDFRYELDR